MTDDRMALQTPLEKASDADLLREMIGFAAEDLIAWCEANGVGYVLVSARNKRLQGELAGALAEARAARARRAIVKAEHLGFVLYGGR